MESNAIWVGVLTGVVAAIAGVIALWPIIFSAPSSDELNSIVLGNGGNVQINGSVIQTGPRSNVTVINNELLDRKVITKLQADLRKVQEGVGANFAEIENLDRQLKLAVTGLGQIGAEQRLSQAVVTEAKHSLLKGDSSHAEKLYLEFAVRKLREGEEALLEVAEAYRSLGALIILRDTEKAYYYIREASRLDPENLAARELMASVRNSLASNQTSHPEPSVVATEGSSWQSWSEDYRMPYGRFPHQECFERASGAYKLPLSLLLAIARGESNFDKDAVSNRNAHGIMQILWPTVAHRVGITSNSMLFDPCINVSAGARYLKELLDLYGNDSSLSLLAYKFGPNRIDINAKWELHEGSWYVRYINNHFLYIIGDSSQSAMYKPPTDYSYEKRLAVLTFYTPERAEKFVSYLRVTITDVRFDWFDSGLGRFSVDLLYQNEKELEYATKTLELNGLILPDIGSSSPSRVRDEFDLASTAAALDLRNIACRYGDAELGKQLRSEGSALFLGKYQHHRRNDKSGGWSLLVNAIENCSTSAMLDISKYLLKINECSTALKYADLAVEKNDPIAIRLANQIRNTPARKCKN